MKAALLEKTDVAAAGQKLASWKSIAKYFNCDERTAKRWERERGLPVYRAPGGKRSVVIAYTSELDSWLHAKKQEKPRIPSQMGTQTVPDAESTSSNNQERPAASTDGRKLVPFIQRSLSRRQFALGGAAMAIILLALATRWAFKYRTPVHGPVSATSSSSLASNHVPAPGAEQLYLEGRYFWNLRTADGLDKAIDLYTQAIVKDPAYAEAYAGLAEAYDLLPQFGRAEMASSLNKAKDAADRAISLNPSLADAHAAKAFALCYGDWDIAGSEAEFQRALALDPNSSMTHHWYASTLHDRGEAPASLHQIAEALQLDPTSAAIATDAAFFQADFGNLDAGLKALKEIERTQPTLASPPDFLRAIDFSRGDFPGYIAETRRYAEVTHNPDEMALADAVALGWARAGRRGMLEERVRFMKAAFDHGSERGFGLGETLLLLGRRQEALAYFKAALNHHDLATLLMQKFPWAPSLTRTPGYVEFFAEARQRAHMGSLAFGKDIPASSEFPWSPPDLDVAKVQ